MKLIVGLGNPGKEYENTRHNIGFMVIDRIKDKLNINTSKKGFHGLYSKFKYKGEDVILLQPHTYMNKSGISVREIADYFQVKLEDIVVIFDDLDLDVGKLRLREKGGHGGHNGIRDIISHLSTNEFKRIRIGIGKNQLIDSVNYVLGKFSKEESELINQALNKASDAIILYLEENFQAAMNKFNQEIV